jgi:hypothetical protein
MELPLISLGVFFNVDCSGNEMFFSITRPKEDNNLLPSEAQVKKGKRAVQLAPSQLLDVLRKRKCKFSKNKS